MAIEIRENWNATSKKRFYPFVDDVPKAFREYSSLGLKRKLRQALTRAGHGMCAGARWHMALK